MNCLKVVVLLFPRLQVVGVVLKLGFAVVLKPIVLGLLQVGLVGPLEGRSIHLSLFELVLEGVFVVLELIDYQKQLPNVLPFRL